MQSENKDYYYIDHELKYYMEFEMPDEILELIFEFLTGKTQGTIAMRYLDYNSKTILESAWTDAVRDCGVKRGSLYINFNRRTRVLVSLGLRERDFRKALMYDVVKFERSLIPIGTFRFTARLLESLPRYDIYQVGVGKDEVVHSGEKERTFLARRGGTKTAAYDFYKMRMRYSLCAKAAVYNWLILGKIVEAKTASQMFANQVNIWMKVVSMIVWFLQTTYEVVSRTVCLLIDSLVVFGGEPMESIIETGVMIFTVVMVYLLLNFIYRINFPATKLKEETVVTREIKFEHKKKIGNQTIFTFIINGQKVQVPINKTEYPSGSGVDEMSIPGSDLFTSVMRPLGAILLSTDSVDMSLLGCFWRYDDYLVTAKHVANAVSSGLANVYLAGVVNSKTSCRVNDSNVTKLERARFELDKNEADTDLDLFIITLTKKEWSKLGVTSASVKADSSYNQTVSAVGFVGGVLMTSNGKTKTGSGHEELWHSASTNKGFSGSPLFCGNSVVGMHVSAASGHNVAIRVEQIKLHMKRQQESDLPEFNEETRSFKYRGSEVDIIREGDYYHLITKTGKVSLRWNREEIESNFSEKQLSRFEQFLAEEEDAEDDANRRAHARKMFRANLRQHYYEDEKAELDYVQHEIEKPVHCNSTPKIQPEVSSYFDQHAEELLKLGYKPEEYAWPDINTVSEETSLKNHLKIFSDGLKTIEKEPSLDCKKRAKHILTNMLSYNKYTPRAGYKTTESLIEIIDSSLVQEGKSPGYPYLADGLPLNRDVIKKFTKGGLAQHTLNEWNSKFHLRWFLKAEANKRKKLSLQRPRGVVGFPLHKMIKHQAIFREMLQAATDNWMNSPIKYAFNPTLPGHIQHLARTFKGRAVDDSDKETWDFTFYEWVFSICRDISATLACQPHDMPDEEFAEYKKDFVEAIDEIIQTNHFRCSNGKVFGPLKPGIMKSGSLLTIFLNSMAQLVVDVVIKINMGYTDEQILSDDFVTMAGGDDVIQSFPDGFDKEKYRAVAQTIGYKLSEFKTHKSFDGCEFFSHVYKKERGVWTYHPTRFTKHIYSLQKTKLEDLPKALASHMKNYVWENKKFDFLSKMFMSLREQHPSIFTLNFHKEKQYLRYVVQGMEVDV